MAYSYGRNYNRSYKKYPKRNKYSLSERIAFRRGMEDRVMASVNKSSVSKVTDAYKAGFNGFESNKGKPLY